MPSSSKPTTSGQYGHSGPNKTRFATHIEYAVHQHIMTVIESKPTLLAAFYRLEAHNHNLMKAERDEARDKARSMRGMFRVDEILNAYYKYYNPGPDDKYLRTENFAQLCKFLESEDEREVSGLIITEVSKMRPEWSKAFEHMQDRGRYAIHGIMTIWDN